MAVSEPTPSLEMHRRNADLSQDELWFRYFELGGMSSEFQVEAFLFGVLRPSKHDHDVLAHALNERFVELGGNHPVPYSSDDPIPSNDATA
jgi:hypothetical protein